MNAFKLINAFQELKTLNTKKRVLDKIATREWELKQANCKMFPCHYPHDMCLSMCFKCFDKGGRNE